MIYVTSERQGDRAAAALFSAGEDAEDVAAAAAAAADVAEWQTAAGRHLSAR